MSAKVAYNDPVACRSGGVSIIGHAVQRDVFYFLEISAESSSHFGKPQVMCSVFNHLFLEDLNFKHYLWFKFSL